MAVVLEVGIPSVSSGISVAVMAALLAASGAALQGLFRNAMADPYLLGISAGGALVESAGPVRPGVRTDLALESADGPRCVRRVEVLRCWVHRLAPLAFRSALQFLGGGEGRG